MLGAEIWSSRPLAMCQGLLHPPPHPLEEWRTEGGVARARRVGVACQHEESLKEWLCRGKFGRPSLKLWLESLGCVEGILGQQTACWIVGLPRPSLLISSGLQLMTYNLSLLEEQRPYS